MKRKSLAAIAPLSCVAALLSLFLLSCGGKTKAPSVDSDLPTVRLITEVTGIEDKSYNAAAWRGIVQFYGDTLENTVHRGSHYDVVAAQTEDMYIPNLIQVAEEGYDLIIATGFTFADALNQVTPQYPDQNFAIIDVDSVLHPNVAGFVYSEEEGSYLVGVAAALQAIEDGIANPRFGFIGGVASPTITKFEMGYVQGIRSILPDAEIVDFYANSWSSPDLAKATAKTWYDNGVYCIFSAAGGTGNGTIEQARECRMAGLNVWAIGVDSDQYEDGIYAEGASAVLTSMIKRVENSTIKALADIERGTFTGGVIRMSLADGGVDYSKSNPALSPSIIAEVDRIKEEIIKGDIRIHTTYSEALAAGAAPEGLSALDD